MYAPVNDVMCIFFTSFESCDVHCGTQVAFERVISIGHPFLYLNPVYCSTACISLLLLYSIVGCINVSIQTHSIRSCQSPSLEKQLKIRRTQVNMLYCC